MSPFDAIVITSPDQKAAIAVRELIISSCGNFCSSSSSTRDEESTSQTLHSSEDGTIFLSSCDPYGARLGSGGGTIAALAEAQEAYYNNTTDGVEERGEPTVLICHAGGESSRCPTQITLGKAWTSLPIDDDVVLNPTALLISTLSDIFRNVPRGSVVVAASDVLLSFQCNSINDNCNNEKKIQFNENDSNNGVFGLAVPAPLSTAQNHGVFIVNNVNDFNNQIDTISDYNTNNNDGWKLQSTFKVLQKPTIDEMMSMSNPSCVFHTTAATAGNANATDNNSEDATTMAWIDTGVITFLPDAVETLKEMSRTVLKNCTRVGLMELYLEKYGGLASDGGEDGVNITTPVSIEEFARGIAPKICLYGDMLHALQTTSSISSSSDNVNLFGALSKHELQTVIIPEGSFVHLGTTGELIDFLVAGGEVSISTNNEGSSDDDHQQQQQTKVQSFAKSIGISSRSNAFLSGFRRGDVDDIASSLVILNSIVIGDGWNKSFSIGEGTVIEHCTIPFSGGSGGSIGKILVGKRCLLSGIRGDLNGRDLCIPSEMCLQLLPLRHGGGFVCLCFGVNDGIKEATSLYGMDLKQVLERSGLIASDLWDDSIPFSRRTLWNAKLHPIMEIADGETNCPLLNFSFLEWIQALRDDVQLDAGASQGLRQWKESKRIAICHIRECVDSEAEAKYRSTISSVEVRQLNLVTNCLVGQKHEPCSFDHLAGVGRLSALNGHPMMKRALKAMDNICYQALDEGKFDIVGRTFMVLSELLSPLCSNDIEPEPAAVELPSTLTSESIAQVIVIRDKMLSEQAYSSCCQLLESMSSMATQRCIYEEKSHSFVYTDPLPVDTAAIVTAPARIDLAGGWSDTPPVSFEYGGAVACLAVLVDGKRPLRAQCRVVKGMTGIRLCTESRSLSDETLLRSSERTIHTLEDLEGFNNPESECALLKCALVWLGLCPVDYIQDDEMKMQSIQPFLQKFCRRGEEHDVGLEIISSSLLPTGSGMGSSSILAGCVIACIAKCIGIVLDGMDTNSPYSTSNSTETNGTNSLVHGVLMVEQLLTSGGGWQDQIGGLVGGLKLATSDKKILPLQTKTRCIKLSAETVNNLNERLILVDTGKPRLAKNILRNVLRRWARRSSDIVATIRELVSEASNAIDYATKGDLDGLGACMSKYWALKKTMAGESSGVEPEIISRVLQLLTSSKKIAGGTLCGAGGGGYLVLMATDGISRAHIESALRADGDGADNEDINFKWHRCTVAEDGLLIDV
eukprot:scaffold9781_cov80-Skeletonema_menzelii.AAC.3